MSGLSKGVGVGFVVLCAAGVMFLMRVLAAFVHEHLQPRQDLKILLAKFQPEPPKRQAELIELNAGTLRSRFREAPGARGASLSS